MNASPGSWVDTSPGLAELVSRALRRHRASVAVVDGERTRTFGEVDERSRRLAAALDAHGVQPGARVALLLGNRLEFIELDVAVLRAGLVKVAVNPWLSDDERRYLLEDCGAEVLITETRFAEQAVALVDEVDALRLLVLVDGEPSDRWSLLDDLVAGARAGGAEPVVLPPDRPSLIIYTSGTTGRPKGATWTVGGRLAATRTMLTDELSIDERDGMLHVGPLSHGSGSKVLAFVLRGARNIPVPSFDPGLIADAVEGAGATCSFMVPTMISRLTAEPEALRARLAGLRHISYGGAPMPRTTLDEALERLGPVLCQVYGSSEAPHPVTVLSTREHGDPALRDTIGRESTGVLVSVRDPDGEPVADGEPGELWVRGANVMSGYWGAPEATAATLVDGWYRTGDVGTRDERGYLRIVDRVKDLIITGGMNVYPAEVERVLREHGAVADVCVVGAPDPEFGEAVTAFVVPRAGTSPDEQELIDHARAGLAGYKKPRRVILLDELPRGSTGKVAKGALRDMVAAAPTGSATEGSSAEGGTDDDR